MEDKKDLEKKRAKAINEGLCFGVTRLRDEFRMKPAPDATPFDWIKSPYRRATNPVYRVADCVPLRERNTPSEPTDKQRIARKISGLKSSLRSGKLTASAQLHSLLQDRKVYLDVETTGLGTEDQIVELGIVDHEGTVLFEGRFNPTVEMDPGAEVVHGISLDILKGEPRWSDRIDEIKAVLSGCKVVIFNAEFDTGMLYSTSRAFGLDTMWVDELDIECAMAWAVEIHGATNRYGTISLANAVYETGLSFEGRAHSAVADAEMTRRVMLGMSELHLPVLKKLQQAEAVRAALEKI